jgi:hypothetical protein
VQLLNGKEIEAAGENEENNEEESGEEDESEGYEFYL